MSGNRLRIIEERVLSKKEQYEQETYTRTEHAWKENPSKLDPACSALGRERVKRTRELLSQLSFEGKEVVDLGCGSAPFILDLEQATITVVDSARSALDRCPESVRRIRGCLPYCRLPEEGFDGVILTDVIAEIDPHLYRLTISEISALMKREAFFLCSTELDHRTEEPLSHFLSLVKTEFEVVNMQTSSHRLFLFIRRCFEAPTRFIRGSQNGAYRQRQLEKRTGLFRLWFFLNSMQGIAYVWWPFVPLKKMLNGRPSILFFEKISEILWGEGAYTHVIVLLKKKSLHRQNN